MSTHPRHAVRAAWTVALVPLLGFLPVGVGGQSTEAGLTMRTRMVVEAEELRSKIGQLGAVFPEERLDWRPMEGVRSFREAFTLVTAEGSALMGGLGLPYPPESGTDFQAEAERLRNLPWDTVLREYETSTENLLDAIRALQDDAVGERVVPFFGSEMTMWTVVDAILDDMHQHLGQLVAYARMHDVVPPWSR